MDARLARNRKRPKKEQIWGKACSGKLRANESEIETVRHEANLVDTEHQIAKDHKDKEGNIPQEPKDDKSMYSDGPRSADTKRFHRHTVYFYKKLKLKMREYLCWTQTT